MPPSDTPIPLRVLLLEDVPDDAALIEQELAEAGYAPRIQLVDTRDTFVAHLRPEIDVVLADHALPQFDALQALDILKHEGLDIPFIIVSGVIQEETAIEAMRRGAADYLLKDRLTRLGPAVQQALREKQNRIEKDRAFETVRQSEAFNRSILASLSAHIAVIDPTGSIVSVNEAWESFSIGNGNPQLEGVGIRTNYLDVCRSAAEQGAPLAAEARDGILSVLEGRRNRFHIEYPCHSPTKQRWFMMRVTPLGGTRGGAVVAHEDVTERREAEERVRASETRYRLLADHATDVIARIAPDGTWLYLSPSCQAMLGYEPAELIGQNAFSFVHPDDMEILQRGMSAIDAHSVPETVTYRALRKDGSYVWVETNGRFLRDPDTRDLQEIVAVLRDVTLRREYEEKLIEAKERAEDMARLKSSFLANMSHEIRTPLTGIIGFSDALAEEASGDVQQIAQHIRSGGERLLLTLDSVLDLAQLESRSLSLHPTVLDLVDEVEQILPFFERQAREKGLDLCFEPAEPRLAATLPKGAFGRILTNLITNAVKFTQTGSVTVRLHRVGAEVEVQVADTGIGIEPAFMGRLFDEFEQESDGESRLYEGVGLGLAITKRLIDLMGGTIEVESAKTAGTTFTVRFPDGGDPTTVPTNTHASVAPLRRATPPCGPVPPERPKILVVEDQRDIHELLTRLLQEFYQPTLASTGEEALAAASREHFDLVLMDVNLGDGMSGEDTLVKLRQQPGYAGVPVVACTAYALPGDQERFLASGFDTYLEKPFRKRDLLAALDGALHRS